MASLTQRRRRRKHSLTTSSSSISLSEAAALQDAMDARSHSVDATSAAFLQAQRKLGEAIAANPDAQREYAQNGQNRTTSVIADVTFNP